MNDHSLSRVLTFDDTPFSPFSSFGVDTPFGRLLLVRMYRLPASASLSLCRPSSTMYPRLSLSCLDSLGCGSVNRISGLVPVLWLVGESVLVDCHIE